MLQTVGIDPDKHIIIAGPEDAVLVENGQVDDPVQVDPIEADVGNDEDIEPNSRDDVDANENHMGSKRKFGS